MKPGNREICTLGATLFPVFRATAFFALHPRRFHGISKRNLSSSLAGAGLACLGIRLAIFMTRSEAFCLELGSSRTCDGTAAKTLRGDTEDVVMNLVVRCVHVMLHARYAIRSNYALRRLRHVSDSLVWYVLFDGASTVFGCFTEKPTGNPAFQRVSRFGDMPAFIYVSPGEVTKGTLLTYWEIPLSFSVQAR